MAAAECPFITASITGCWPGLNESNPNTDWSVCWSEALCIIGKPWFDDKLRYINTPWVPNARPKSMNKADLVQIIIQQLEDKLHVAHASTIKSHWRRDRWRNSARAQVRHPSTWSFVSGARASDACARKWRRASSVPCSCPTWLCRCSYRGWCLCGISRRERCWKPFYRSCSGGLTVKWQGKEVFVLTPKSPLVVLWLAEKKGKRLM